jgi:hypothetical protein
LRQRKWREVSGLAIKVAIPGILPPTSIIFLPNLFPGNITLAIFYGLVASRYENILFDRDYGAGAARHRL